MKEYPHSLEKKVKLLNYFMNYMKEHLLKAGGNIAPRDGDELARIPFLRTWFRTSRAVVMFLTNGTLQVCLCLLVVFHDSVSIRICFYRSTSSRITPRWSCVLWWALSLISTKTARLKHSGSIWSKNLAAAVSSRQGWFTRSRKLTVWSRPLLGELSLPSESEKEFQQWLILLFLF